MLVTTTVSLTACATNGAQKSLSSGEYAQAQMASNVQTQVIREYVPVPVPGQLRPVPSVVGADVKKPTASKELAVKNANQAAQQFPESTDFFNAMMTYNYMPGALYTIYAAPLKITDIRLEKGEKIISQAAGDTLRWQIASTYSGEGDDIFWHILVKPQRDDLENTLIITTNKRTYHLILQSTDSDSYMVSVNWNYPQDMVQTFVGPTLGQDGNTMSAASGVVPQPPVQDRSLDIDVSEMEFAYTWQMEKGPTPAWFPEQVFSVGHQTYIKFPQQVLDLNTEMPVPMIQTDDGQYAAANFNWRMSGSYMIIDTVIKNAYLKAGTSESQEVIVKITRNA